MTDWAVGDLALCVDDSPCQCGSCSGVPINLFAGNHYRVLAISNPHQRGNPNHTWISLDVGAAPSQGHAPGGQSAHRFRKIHPDEREACEPEFVQLLKRTRRTVKA